MFFSVSLAAESGGASKDAPVTVKVGMELSATNWNGILSAIQTAGTYVALNLADCAKSTHSSGGGLYTTGSFDPNYAASTGKDRIVSLVLPDAAASIAAGTSSSNATFKGFTSLKSVSGAKAASIGNYAFYYCSKLTSADFPQVTSIGNYAFNDCISLTSVSFPQATSIGTWAFNDCTGLASVSFPLAATIDDFAFYDCSKLTSVSFPAAATIGKRAFDSGTALTSFTLTGTGALDVIESGKALVRNNTELVAYPSAAGSITLSAITSIGTGAFAGCSGLTSVSLPAATSIGAGAFALTGTAALSITLGGSKAPTVGESMFLYLTATKTVTVRYPKNASGYGTAPTDTSTNNWGNAFRGKGWDGTSYGTGTVNSNITLTYQTYTP